HSRRDGREPRIISAPGQHRHERGGESRKHQQSTKNYTCKGRTLATHRGTLTVFKISFNTASASSLRRNEDEKRELTTMRCANTGTTRRLMSSGMQYVRSSVSASAWAARNNA